MRSSSVRVLTGISCLLFAGAAWYLAPHSSSAFTANAQTAHTAKPAVAASSAAKLQPASVSNTTGVPAPIAAPGTEIYTAKRGEAIPTIAHRYLSHTSYLTSSELADAIRSANHKSDGSNILKANEQIIIPGIIPGPVTEKTIPVPRDFEVRAVYLTGFMAGSDHGIRVIKHWREVGGNAVVFDIKDSDGSVTIPFEHPLLGQHPVYIHDVPKLVHFLHSQNMHAIARIAIFRDERLVVAHPELAVQSRKNHTAWRENGKLVWTDPSNPKVQDYDIALAKYVAGLGVDEIQFDYVRFPAEGDQQDAVFEFQKNQPQPAPDATKDSKDPAKDAVLTVAKADGGTLSQPAATMQSKVSQSKAGRRKAQIPQPAEAPKNRGPQRSDVIAGFLKKAYSELHPTGVLLSLDVFGVMAWQRPIDLSHTGQDIVQMAHYCDVLSPMIYPSHFFGMDGIAHPGDEPAHFIGESMDRFELITKGSGVVIRPWLQAFHWRTKTYSPEYIKIQVETAKEKGGVGFLFWNAANDYSKPFTAMPEMKSANVKEGSKDPRYFRGDELPSATVQASLNPAPGTR
ncbi:MAG TPA: putative glycoside hydrolase [Candidatus Sulfotelmatobacter sp.]|nr:putative glycoside hydrolase [Candidatus Sulfotelmatobacter sp.]